MPDIKKYLSDEDHYKIARKHLMIDLLHKSNLDDLEIIEESFRYFASHKQYDSSYFMALAVVIDHLPDDHAQKEHFVRQWSLLRKAA